MEEYVAYRCSSYRSPFWDNPNPQAGRFNRAGEAPTTYLGLHPLTPWAELLRASDRRTAEQIRQLRPVSWAARVLAEADQVLELSFDNAAQYGLAPEELVGEDYGPCQALAGALRSDPEAEKVIIAPSAALPGTRTMILLGARVSAPYMLETNIDPEVDTSVSPTAVLGSSLLALAASVHYKDSGIAHAGLDAWHSGDVYEFTEPPVADQESQAA